MVVTVYSPSSRNCIFQNLSFLKDFKKNIAMSPYSIPKVLKSATNILQIKLLCQKIILNRAFSIKNVSKGSNFFPEKSKLVMYQSFASPAPPGPANSGALKFSIFKARHCQARFVVKPLLKAPAPRGLTTTWNNSWELF